MRPDPRELGEVVVGWEMEQMWEGGIHRPCDVGGSMSGKESLKGSWILDWAWACVVALALDRTWGCSRDRKVKSLKALCDSFVTSQGSPRRWESQGCGLGRSWAGAAALGRRDSKHRSRHGVFQRPMQTFRSIHIPWPVEEFSPGRAREAHWEGQEEAKSRAVRGNQSQTQEHLRRGRGQDPGTETLPWSGVAAAEVNETKVAG